MTDFTGIEVEEFFESLPERQMQVARMLFAGDTLAEIGGVLGMTRQGAEEIVKNLRIELDKWLNQ